jgi:hypothetical protein
MDIGDDRINLVVPWRWGRVRCFGRVLGPEESEIVPDLGLTPVAAQVFTNLGPGIAEQRSVDELDGRGRALDIQEHDPAVVQLA